MGLKDQPEFEGETETETTTTTAPADAAATVKASTAIAKAASTAVGQAKKFVAAFKDFEHVLDRTTVEGLSLAVPRIKGEQGSFFRDNEDLGGKIQFKLVSYNARWVIGTGTEDKEAKDYFRVSYDDKTLSGTGESVAEYIKDLKEKGFSKANKSQYLDVWAFITWTENKGDIDVENREIVCLQCSQTSVGAFMAFATTRGLLESEGLVKPLSTIEAHAEKRVKGTNKYTNFSFHAPKTR